MGFLSKLCPCFQDPEGENKKRETHLEASAPADSSPEGLAQSSLRIEPVSNTSSFLHQTDNRAVTSAAHQSNSVNLPSQPSQNSPDDMEDFYREIDGWKWNEWKRGHSNQNRTRFVKDLACNEDSPFLEMLPDGMIPIRRFVKTLVYICKKAADFALAEEEVFLFIQEVAGWLDIVYSAFDSRSELGDEAWKVLDEIRKLIDAALNWSSNLVPNQWLFVQSQIQVYRTAFAKISRRFGLTLGLRLVKDLYGMPQEVERIAQDVKMMSENASTIQRLEFLKKQLKPLLTEKQTYNDQDKGPCDRDTRQDILMDIRLWIQDVSESSKCFYWLSGAPGVGKSAITVSTAKECIDLKILGAQFFINRNDPTTTNPRALFPTICWTLCDRFRESVAVAMEEVLRACPTLVDDISEDQAKQLFVKAIEVAVTGGSRVVVIVIDALDETDTKRLQDLATIFSKVVTDLPPNAKVFISSRTEEAVTKSFNPLCTHKRVKFRHLKATDSVDEVSQYMEKEIKKILQDNKMNWDDWGDDTMRTLSPQAAGLFIWAKTALNFLQDEIGDKGKTYFPGFLEVLKTDGTNDIDALYLAILQRKCKSGKYQCFRRIIGTILVLQTPLSIADITQLLNLKERSNFQPVDLVHFVRQYRTVLVDNTGVIHDRLVPRMHKSFADFITSARAEEFRVDKSASHGDLALRCIDRLSDLIKYLKSNKKTQVSFPSQLVYVSQYWQSHLTRTIEPNMDDAEEEKEYDMPDIPEHDTQSLPANSPDMEPDAAETERMEWRQLGFSPDGTQIALSLSDEVDIQIRDTRTNSMVMLLGGHTDDVQSIGFSPDGTQLVSASDDDTARIWDVRTGEVLHVLDGAVNYVAFSHDGRIMVTCSVDETLHTWDSSTGQLLRVFQGHTSIPAYCTFSLNDQRIASCARFDEIIVWDINSGDLISKFYHDRYRVISFCPCGNHLMSCNDYEETKLWDVESGEQLDHTNSIIVQLALAGESASGYINVPPALLEPVNSNTPHLYTLEMKTGMTVHGIAEHGQSVWISVIDDEIVYFDAGGTRTL